MPKIKHRVQTSRNVAILGPYKTISDAEAGRPCVGHEECRNPIVPDAPVRLCGFHIRQVYGFASDLLESNWDGAVREYVSDLHATFKPPKAVKQPKAGWVYFIRFGDRVKIGFTTEPKRRMSELPHDTVLGMVHGTRDDEAAWHKLLADYRTVGEWFLAEPEVLAAIQKVLAA